MVTGRSAARPLLPPALLEAHQRLLRDSLAGRGGVEVATEGQQRGARMSMEEAVSFALEESSPS